MPELPEVETVVRDLRAAGLAGRRIRRVRVFWPRSVASPTPARLQRALPGHTIQAIRRRAKYLILELLPANHLVFHLRMTGRLLLEPPGPPEPHDRIILELDDGRTLRFRDSRTFGRCWLLPDSAQLFGRLGPEPLSPQWTARRLARALAARRRVLKPLLLDQHFLAGLGNIYADEALWLAALHPQRQAADLTPAEAHALWRAIRQVLRKGIRNLGTSLGGGQTNFRRPGGHAGANRERLEAYGRAGQPCARCQTALVRIRVAQRTTCFCPRCQPE